MCSTECAHESKNGTHFAVQGVINLYMLLFKHCDYVVLFTAVCMDIFLVLHNAETITEQETTHAVLTMII